MSFRKILFWSHLIAGVISGIVIGIMCFAGTAIAFEKQLIAWSERDVRRVPVLPADQTRLSVDELTTRVRSAFPEAKPTSIVVSADPHQAVMFSSGRDDHVFANPYTGEVHKPTSTRTLEAMQALTEWHRFLALTGDKRATGKLINGICNISFCVLAITGLYLWMPRRWSWASVRAVGLFNVRLTGKARDFNWHNAIGLWSAPVLIVLTLTAIPISFRWGSNLVYTLVGEEPPAQPGQGGASPQPRVEVPKPAAGTNPLPREAQFAVIRKAFPHWELITFRATGAGRGAPPVGTGAMNPLANEARAGAAPTTTDSGPGRPSTNREGTPQPANFVVKTRGAWPRTATTSVALNPFTGDVLQQEAFADQTAGRRLRGWTRFLHTGEALGVGGQLIAGLASLGGCVLVYTGFALAWRRFVGRRVTKAANT